MWKVTWRNLLARKVRLLLSAFAIVLGVAFVAGSMIFTDAMGGAFDDIIEGSTSDVEVAYEGANDFDAQQDNRTIPAGVVREAREAAGGRVRPPAGHPPDRLRDRRRRQGDRRQRPARPGVQLLRCRVPDRQADPRAGRRRSARRARRDRPRRRHRREGRLRPRRRGHPRHPGHPADHAGEADRRGRVRLRRPQRGHPHDLRPRVPAGEVLRRQGRLHLGLAQRRRRRLTAGARRRGSDGASRGRAGPDRRRLRRREPGLARRDPGLPRDVPAGLRGGLAGRRHLPDHQHLLDPGRPAQPRAGAAPGPRRLPPADQPIGGHRGARGRASSAPRSGSASATCSPSGCAGCSASSASTSAARSSRSPGRRWPGRTASGWW